MEIKDSVTLEEAFGGEEVDIYKVIEWLEGASHNLNTPMEPVIEMAKSQIRNCISALEALTED